MSQTVQQRKGAALPVTQTPAQKAAATRAAKKAQADALARVNAQRLAQIVNLHIAGMSLTEIGASIGATAEEVDRMLQTDAARYVRSQPALRVYVRNWISERYAKMLEADWEQASDADHNQKLEHQDRVLRILADMRRLHGADAPVQTEVKVEAAPEAVERLVSALASQKGLGYDVDIFDAVDAEVVHESVEQSHAALEASTDVAGDDEGWGNGDE